MSDYKVEIASPEEVAEILKKRPMGPENKNGRRSIVGYGGFEIKGEFALIARDAVSNEIEWEHSEKNLVTDGGRRVWFDFKFVQTSPLIGFSPDVRTPNTNRYTSTTDSAQSFTGSATVVITPATHTKTYSITFGTPASNRTLGTIFLTWSGNTVNMGPTFMSAYTLLTPSRVQTTTNTLEVIYKVSMNPIY